MHQRMQFKSFQQQNVSEIYIESAKTELTLLIKYNMLFD